MRTIVLLVMLVAAVTAVNAQVENTDNPVSANWSQLGPAVEGSRGYTLFGRGIRLSRTGQYELWVKIVPASTPAFVKRYSLPRATAYVMQHATVDCENRLLLLEKTSAFDSGDRVIAGNTSALTPGSKREPVKQGSIGESIYKYVCVESTTLPMKPRTD